MLAGGPLADKGIYLTGQGIRSTVSGDGELPSVNTGPPEPRWQNMTGLTSSDHQPITSITSITIITTHWARDKSGIMSFDFLP